MVHVAVDSALVLVDNFCLETAAVVADCNLEFVAVVSDFVDPVSVFVGDFHLEIVVDMVADRMVSVIDIHFEVVSDCVVFH